jgi:IS30 family transposase
MINFIFVELMNKTYKRLTLNERIIIETITSKKKSKSYMAIHLNRSRSTINNELKKMADKTYLTPTVQHSLNGTQTQLTLIKNTRQNKHYKSLKIYLQKPIKWI